MNEKEIKPPKISTFSKMLSVLKCFSIYNAELTFKEINSKIKIPDSTLYRYLQILEDEHLIARDEDTGKYTIGMNIISMAGIALENMDIRRLAHIHIDDLSQKLNLNTNLGIIYQGDLLHLDFSVREKVDSHHAILGRRSPLHTTAMGKALLASLSDSEVRSIITTYGWRPSTPYSINNFDTLFENLNSIRKQGYATDIKESGISCACLGAAIKKKGGKPIAALSVSTTLKKFDEAFENIRDSVIMTARDISSLFGYIE